MTGREFRNIRLRLGFTQGELAKRLERGREIINAWERGRQKIPRVVDYAMHYLLILERRKKKG